MSCREGRVVDGHSLFGDEPPLVMTSSRCLVDLAARDYGSEIGLPAAVVIHAESQSPAGAVREEVRYDAPRGPVPDGVYMRNEAPGLVVLGRVVPQLWRIVPPVVDNGIELQLGAQERARDQVVLRVVQLEDLPDLPRDLFRDGEAHGPVGGHGLRVVDIEGEFSAQGQVGEAVVLVRAERVGGVQRHRTSGRLLCSGRLEVDVFVLGGRTRPGGHAAIAWQHE